LIQHVLHVPNPEDLSDERLTLLISRIKWLYEKKWILGVTMNPQPGGIYKHEDDLLNELSELTE
jgi:hypothetical protein